MKLFPVFIAVLLFLPSIQIDKHFVFYDGMLRSYIIHVPTSYHGQKFPLVIVLHGGGGNSWRMMEKTGFSNAADEFNFIVVYPDGTWKLNEHPLLNAIYSLILWKYRFFTWNAGYCCGYAFEKGVDDVGYIEKLIDILSKRYNIDSHRIYVVGHSNGGILAYYVASSLSSKIAAVGVVAASIGGYANENSSLWKIPSPAHPVSIIHIHGLRDTHIPYNGGHGENASGSRIDLSVNDSISFWVNADGCNEKETYFIYDGKIKVDDYKGGKNNTEVVLYTLIEGKHAWPGKNYNYYGFNATTTICNFLLNHPKY